MLFLRLFAFHLLLAAVLHYAVGAGRPAGVWQAEGTLLRWTWVHPIGQEALEEQSRLRSKVEEGLCYIMLANMLPSAKGRLLRRIRRVAQV